MLNPGSNADREALLKQIEEYLKALEANVQSKLDDDSYFELDALELPKIEAVSGELDERRRRQLLTFLGVVNGLQGTSRVWLNPAREANAKTCLDGVRALLDQLSKVPAQGLTKEDAETVIKPTGADRSNVVKVLQVLELVSGLRGRTGGVILATALAPTVAAAKASFVEADAKPVPVDTITEHEKVYYPLAADALVIEGYEAHVTGVRQRRSGEWSTPDVVGFYCRAMPSTLVPVVRVATVEVKHKLTRSGVAEALAHRRFAHYSYVAAAETFGDIQSELREECIRNGLGLMCFKQKNSTAFEVYIEPVMNRPDEELVDEFLMSIKTEAGDELLGERVAPQVRSSLGRALFPS